MFRFLEIYCWIIKYYTLLPHKSKEFIKPTAEKMGHSEELVDDVTSFYWQQIRNTLSNPVNTAITVINFGVFSIKPWKLDQFIEKCDGIIKHTKVDTYKMYASVKQLEKKRIIIDKLVVKVQELKIKKQSIKEKRYGKGDQPDLEK